MKNKLIDLNNHLFAQLERLSDESLKGEALQDEIHRSKSVTQISTQIVANARLALDAQIAANDMGVGRKLPEMLEAKNG
ncbi:hypothetical protein ACRN9J_07155 [Shewanella baltica]|uniref:Phage protein n=1 Tax=Shewanella oncorhynchi TaxID=2726434 RepID=A0ABX1KJZ5_9GAMM|nr:MULTISPECIES: hypothetical protein [Shewanella]MCS6175315.1 hypothetical protein [Shewanella baltica]MCU8000199.1 hypothetical protein [Shewanella sp. SM95]MCU8008450.1 hypothetical protein [Shewanella sp. SM87]MCU8057742.1 hypothetical protein [Shewanella sp. SM35]MCU8066572.1 hypothetical protein [Shewanella sp. SM34]